MKEFVADFTSHLLMAAMALIILVHFILIQLFGSVLIYESSPIGLAIEITLMVSVVSLGIWRLVARAKAEGNYNV